MRLWSALAKRTRARYSRQGVTYREYNSYAKLSVKQRKALREAFPAKSGPQAVAQKKAQQKASKSVAPKTVDLNAIVEHAVTILPGHPPKIRRTVRANVPGMTVDEMRKALTASYQEWASEASAQFKNNPWYYHAINRR